LDPTRKQINLRSLWCGVANLVAGALLLINPVFASPSNAYSIHWNSNAIAGIVTGSIISLVAFIQIIVALTKKRVPAPKAEMNKFAYLAIGCASYFLPALFITDAGFQAYNIPPFWLLAFIMMLVFARKSRIQNLGSILVSAILLLTATSLALIIAELI
jgi:type IV secretory pathway VirB2 component (pilin)